MSEATTLPYPDCDLRAHPPRSPRATLGGLVLLPRTIDKMRAKLQGTLGYYKIGPGLSAYLLEWLGVSEDAFADAVRNAANDDEVVAWLTARADPGTFPAINERLLQRGIRDDEHFAQVLPHYPVLREHPHLRNWFEILELDDQWIFDPSR
ncbi:hypothetical protein WPS_32840 [Vulcanimicrobium alpinum]|uniref:DUF5069 domain-containing protein n=1 Tax=Vulcanimicrobium alpinum TaxID=3016050 RepID=A0AAN2CBG9_UNVUL|nr:DUF5069 domain-containing protein [Vulcanimicrobium alpinum]BDE08008.1 hypothetical protein WPS_32840 [Vulcanimicrobium alpinum]